MNPVWFGACDNEAEIVVQGKHVRRDCAASAVLVNPAAPRIEVFGPALISDGVERPDLHAVVQRDRDGPDFASVGLLYVRTAWLQR